MSTTQEFEVDDDRQAADISVVRDDDVVDVRDTTAAARIRTARFREKLRGYHPDDVDDFLEQLALLVEDQERRVADLSARLEEAQKRTSAASVNEQTVRRTLVLAQRTAELAVTEAQSRAAAIVAEAEEQAQARVRAVEAEIGEAREREERRLRDDLARLHEANEQAADDLEALNARRAEEHARLTEVLSELAAVVDSRLQPTGERQAPPPPPPPPP